MNIKLEKNDKKVVKILAVLDYDHAPDSIKIVLDNLLTLALKSIEGGQEERQIFEKYYDENIGIKGIVSF